MWSQCVGTVLEFVTDFGNSLLFVVILLCVGSELQNSSVFHMH